MMISTDCILTAKSEGIQAKTLGLLVNAHRFTIQKVDGGKGKMVGNLAQ